MQERDVEMRLLEFSDASWSHCSEPVTVLNVRLMQRRMMAMIVVDKSNPHLSAADGWLAAWKCSSQWWMELPAPLTVSVPWRDAPQDCQETNSALTLRSEMSRVMRKWKVYPRLLTVETDKELNMNICLTRNRSGPKNAGPAATRFCVVQVVSIDNS